MLGVIAPRDYLSADKVAIVALAPNQETKWTAARTPWGHPDIQGVWTSTGMRFVPLERARQLGTRGVLNEREAARRHALGPDNGPTLTPDIAERKPHTSRQASLVVDPSDGRIPLTPIALEELKEREKTSTLTRSSMKAPSSIRRCSWCRGHCRCRWRERRNLSSLRVCMSRGQLLDECETERSPRRERST
jgi:hypothetical protein